MLLRVAWCMGHRVTSARSHGIAEWGTVDRDVDVIRKMREFADRAKHAPIPSDRCCGEQHMTPSHETAHSRCSVKYGFDTRASGRSNCSSQCQTESSRSCDWAAVVHSMTARRAGHFGMTGCLHAGSPQANTENTRGSQTTGQWLDLCGRHPASNTVPWPCVAVACAKRFVLASLRTNSKNARFG
jgi:hypothetical protein